MPSCLSSSPKTNLTHHYHYYPRTIRACVDVNTTKTTVIATTAATTTEGSESEADDEMKGDGATRSAGNDAEADTSAMDVETEYQRPNTTLNLDLYMQPPSVFFLSSFALFLHFRLLGKPLRIRINLFHPVRRTVLWFRQISLTPRLSSLFVIQLRSPLSFQLDLRLGCAVH
jgi:hypothetical protein